MSLGDKRPPQPSALANEEASSSLLEGVAERWRTSLVCGLGGQEDRRTGGQRAEGQENGGQEDRRTGRRRTIKHASTSSYPLASASPVLVFSFLLF